MVLVQRFTQLTKRSVYTPDMLLLPLFQGRTEELQRRMADEGIDLLLLTNVDSIYYYTAYWGDLGLEFGRPTMVAVSAGGKVTLITAASECLMARAMTWVEDIET